MLPQTLSSPPVQAGVHVKAFPLGVVGNVAPGTATASRAGVLNVWWTVNVSL